MADGDNGRIAVLSSADIHEFPMLRSYLTRAANLALARKRRLWARLIY
jgi:hypothetical protein